MKKRCYIAGKIGELKPEVFLPLFEQGINEVYIMGYEPVSPTKLPHEHGKSVPEFLRIKNDV